METKTKFQVLKYNRALMTWIGIYPKQLTRPKNEFYKSPIAYLFFCCWIGGNIVSGTMFIYKFSPPFGTNLELIIAGIQLAGMYFSLGARLQDVKALHLKLQEIVDTSEDEFVNIYWTTEQKCRKILRRFCLFIVFNQVLFVTTFLYSIFCILVKRVDIWELPLSFNMILPFDTKTNWGWYLMWSFQFCISFSYATTMVSITSYFISCCLFIETICNHFNLIVNSVNEIVQNEEEEKPNKYSQIYKKIKEKLSRTVEIHNEVCMVFGTTVDINSGIIFSLFPPNAVFMALAMYNFEHTKFTILDFVFCIIVIVCSLIWPYLYCSYCTFTTEQMLGIDDAIYGSNWYLYPTDLQKYLILIIARSEKPVYFTGFGLFKCTLEMFGKLTKSSFSYYLIFRSISQY